MTTSDSATLLQNSPVEFTRVLGIGASRGDLLVPNSELVEAIESSDEWIRQRTGIKTRVRASKDVSVVDMAIDAATKALAHAGIAASELDAVIISTISFPYQTPSAAALVAEKIGATGAAAWDINAACAGYCYAIGQADALVHAGQAKLVLAIGVEKLTDFIDPTDRSISFLLGDGAGAAIVGPSDTPAIGPTVWGSDGENWTTIRQTNSWLEMRDEGKGWPTLEQDGRTVFRWAVWNSAKVVKNAIAAAGLTVEDIEVFIPHQANMRIVDELVKQLKFADSVVVARDIADTGNTSAASIPLATDRLIQEGQVTSGQIAVQIGFGAGLVFAAQVIRIP